MSQNLALPSTQEAVLARLLDSFPELSPQLQIAARYIIDNPTEVGVQTMRALAAEADVHPNSFVRLARQLGFDGYEDMRERFRDFVRTGAGSSSDRTMDLQAMAEQGGTAGVLSRMVQANLGNLDQLVASDQVEALDQAVAWLFEARRVFVLAVGAGYPVAYNFWYVARMMLDNITLVPRHGTLPQDELVNIGADDLLLAMTFQPYRSDVLNTLRFAAGRGAKTIGLSDSPASPACREADLALHAPTHTPQFFHSNSTVIALVEILCAQLAAHGGSETLARIEGFSQMRWKLGIYEE